MDVPILPQVELPILPQCSNKTYWTLDSQNCTFRNNSKHIVAYHIDTPWNIIIHRLPSTALKTMNSLFLTPIFHNENAHFRIQILYTKCSARRVLGILLLSFLVIGRKQYQCSHPAPSEMLLFSSFPSYPTSPSCPVFPYPLTWPGDWPCCTHWPDPGILTDLTLVYPLTWPRYTPDLPQRLTSVYPWPAPASDPGIPTDLTRRLTSVYPLTWPRYTYWPDPGIPTNLTSVYPWRWPNKKSNDIKSKDKKSKAKSQMQEVKKDKSQVARSQNG